MALPWSTALSLVPRSSSGSAWPPSPLRALLEIARPGLFGMSRGSQLTGCAPGYDVHHQEVDSTLLPSFPAPLPLRQTRPSLFLYWILVITSYLCQPGHELILQDSVFPFFVDIGIITSSFLKRLCSTAVRSEATPLPGLLF